MKIEIEAIKRENDTKKLKSLQEELANYKEKRNEINAKWTSEKEVVDKVQSTKENIEKFKLKNIKAGILISSVKEGSVAQEAGLLPGMVIVRVGQIEVNSIDVIEDAIKNAIKQKRKAILLLVKFESGTRFVALELK